MKPRRLEIIAPLLAGLLTWAAAVRADPPQPPRQQWHATVGVGDGRSTVHAGRVYAVGLFAQDGQGAAGRRKKLRCVEVLTCLDAASGRQIWRREVAADKVRRGRAREYEHAAAVLADGRLYVRSCWGGLHCFKPEAGVSLWSRSAAALDVGSMDHGYQAPAVVAGGLVLSVTRSTVGRRDVRLQALDAADGTVAWTLPLGKDGLGRWSPPTVANIEGRDTVVLLYNQMILGVDLVQGRRLWSFDAMAQADLPGQAGTIGHTPEDAHSPRISGRVVVAEYRHFQIKGALACDSTCLGVKIVDGQPELLWKRDEMVNWWDGQAVRNGRLYGIVRHPRGRFNATIAKYHYRHKQQRAALGCYDMHTGQCLWSSEHPWTSDQTDESFQAAELTLHGDRIVLHDEQRLVIGHIGQQGYTPLTAWRLRGPAAAPTVAGDRLYVRTVADGQLTCFNLPSRPESQE